LSKLREIEVDKRTTPLQGKITLTAPELLGRTKVLPLVDAFLRLNKDVAARVFLLDRLTDLVAEGIDIAVRVATLPDSSLSAVKIGEVSTFICASPDYLARSGRPTKPQELDDHECIGLRSDICR
jgi:DNA-binding transcriptional LysR family regulator